ncbi:SPOR domain-containing protein [bacterium]|nr:SPOR domain-containing protein [bacterium]
MVEQQHDHLEFNDGLGDLLREKKPDLKSSRSSLWIAILAVACVVVIFGVAFKLGTSMLFRAKVGSTPAQVSKTDVASVDSENKKLIRDMEALLLQASANVSGDSEPSGNLASAPKPESQPKSHGQPKIVQRGAPVVSKPRPKIVRSVPVVSRTVVVAKPAARSVSVATTSLQPLIRVSAGTFASKSEAAEIEGRLKSLGYPVYVKEHGTGWMLQVGAFRNRSVADEIVATLQRKGFNAAIVSQ